MRRERADVGELGQRHRRVAALLDERAVDQEVVDDAEQVFAELEMILTSSL